jgi:hypothetical protein
MSHLLFNSASIAARELTLREGEFQTDSTPVGKLDTESNSVTKPTRNPSHPLWLVRNDFLDATPHIANSVANLIEPLWWDAGTMINDGTTIKRVTHSLTIARQHLMRVVRLCT